MIYAVCFSMAVLLLLLGHFFRMLRWKQFVSIYEKTNNGMLLSSLMVGYSINFFVPFRVGDIVRAVISGKKLKNGIAFSLSTIIVEHFMDIPVVCAVFVVMDLLNMGGTDTHNGAVLYLCLTAVMLVAGAIVIRFSGVIKSIAKSVCSIFNHTIEYGWSRCRQPTISRQSIPRATSILRRLLLRPSALKMMVLSRLRSMMVR